MPSNVIVRPATRRGQPLEGPRNLANAAHRICRGPAADRIVVDHRAQHDRVVRVDPERALLSGRPLRLRHGCWPIERRQEAVQPATLDLERVVVDEAVADVEVEELIERAIERVDLGGCVLRQRSERECQNQQCRRACVSHPRHYASEKTGQRGIEGGRRLEVGEMPGSGDDDQLGLRLGGMHLPGVFYRRQRVLLTGHDQRRHRHALQGCKRVGTIHHPHDGGADCLRRLLLDQASHERLDIWTRVLRRLPQQLRHHVAGHARRALAIDQRHHAAAIPAPFRRVCACARVGQDHGSRQRRHPAEHRKRDVAAHRQSTDDRRLDLELAQQIDHIVRIVVDARRGIGSRQCRSAEAAHVRRDQPPACRKRLRLALPHRRAQRKGVREHEDARRTIARR